MRFSLNWFWCFSLYSGHMICSTAMKAEVMSYIFSVFCLLVWRLWFLLYEKLGFFECLVCFLELRFIFVLSRFILYCYLSSVVHVNLLSSVTLTEIIRWSDGKEGMRCSFTNVNDVQNLIIRLTLVIEKSEKYLYQCKIRQSSSVKENRITILV